MKFNIEDLSKTDTLYKLDLSNRNFKSQPDLSEFTILDLDLSHNKIAHFEEKKLPKGIYTLNISHNKLSRNIIIREKRNFKKLDFSFNKIEVFYYQNGISQNLNLSDNRLKDLQMAQYNKKLADTLNVANNKDLETKSWYFPQFYNHLVNYSLSTKN
ncbi:hypothetical protein [Flavobacterium suncheonense]|uniref:Uncharacterized protein n=1 Tax=Flavobacterium suncheonense GH29-5 = DSM 17707 TaxID=1121899 RepID=A0A0A2MC27_9FLAO|nr:hypothetical protein [Flavobacterium suncheonense]KGO90207.1 hypothetical protein Q764_03880 [Flavobacterium suncheonense GH29-5 = DSM 17707]